MFALLLLSMIATYEAAPAGAFPNGTETALHFYSCDPSKLSFQHFDYCIMIFIDNVIPN